MEATPLLVERLTATVNRLPLNKVQEVLDFADYLLTIQELPSPVSTESEDAILKLIGLFDSGINDLAENHDKYLTAIYAANKTL